MEHLQRTDAENLIFSKLSILPNSKLEEILKVIFTKEYKVTHLSPREKAILEIKALETAANSNN